MSGPIAACAHACSLEKDVLPAAAMAAGRAADALFAAQESMLRTLHMRLEASTHARLQDVALDNAAYTEIHRVSHLHELCMFARIHSGIAFRSNTLRVSCLIRACSSMLAGCCPC